MSSALQYDIVFKLFALTHDGSSVSLKNHLSYCPFINSVRKQGCSVVEIIYFPSTYVCSFPFENRCIDWISFPTKLIVFPGGTYISSFLLPLISTSKISVLLEFEFMEIWTKSVFKLLSISNI